MANPTFNVPYDLVNLQNHWIIDGFDKINFNDSNTLISHEFVHEIDSKKAICLELHLGNDVTDSECLNVSIKKLSAGELEVIACSVSILDKYKEIENEIFSKDIVTFSNFDKANLINFSLQSGSLTILCEIVLRKARATNLVDSSSNNRDALLLGDTENEDISTIQKPNKSSQEISYPKERDLVFSQYITSSATSRTSIPNKSYEKEFVIEDLSQFEDLFEIVDGHFEIKLEKSLEDDQIVQFNLIALQEIWIDGSIDATDIRNDETCCKANSSTRLLTGQTLTKQIICSRHESVKITIQFHSIGLPIADGSYDSVVREFNPSENKFPTDVTFYFPNGQKLHAHKSFVIWLPSLSKLLAKNEQIQSTEFDLDVFVDLLNLLYTGQIKLTETTRIIDFLILASKCGIFENAYSKVLKSIPETSYTMVHQLLLIMGTIMNIEEMKTKSIDYLRAHDQFGSTFSIFDKPPNCCVKVRGERCLYAHKEILEKYNQFKIWFADERTRYDFGYATYAAMARFLTFCYARYFGIELSYGPWAEKLLFLAACFGESDLKEECVAHLIEHKSISAQNYLQMTSFSKYSSAIEAKLEEFSVQLRDSKEELRKFFKDYYTYIGLTNYNEDELAPESLSNVEEVIQRNQSYLCENINHQTAALYLGIAVHTHCDALKTNCINYICRNAKIVIDTDAYQELVENHPNIILELNLDIIETEPFQALDNEQETCL